VGSFAQKKPMMSPHGGRIVDKKLLNFCFGTPIFSKLQQAV
jgi:hypothetical protein